MNEDIPLSALANERSPSLISTYCYVIADDFGNSQFFSQWDAPIAMTNLPGYFNAGDPQVFLPSQIRHGTVEKTDHYEAKSSTLEVSSEDTLLRRFFTVASPLRLKAWIIRVLGAPTQDITAIDFAEHCWIVESGILSHYGFKGNVIAAKLTPEPFYVDKGVPRYYCQRTCQHQLYGAGCGLDKNDFKIETTIVSVNPSQREMIVTDQDAAEGWLDQGHLFHVDSQLLYTIGWNRHEGADTKIKMVNWTDEFQPGNSLIAYAGCAKNVEVCTSKFDNVANFGGFPFVPNRNPSLNSV